MGESNMPDWIEALADEDLTATPVKGRLARAWRCLATRNNRRNRARDSRTARRACRRAVRVTMATGCPVQFRGMTAWDVI
jgi:hypothetical protein